MTTHKNFIPLSIPHISGNEWNYVKDCLDTGWVSSVGAYVNKFEADLAQYVGAPYAVAMVNGTAALHISLLLLGVNAGDEVIVPTLTFIAPINAVRYVGASPVFMDCDSSLNMDLAKLTEFCEQECSFQQGHLVNKSTGKLIKAIILVHVFGHPVDMIPIKALSDKYNIRIIEDSTEALGSFYTSGPHANKKAGTIGDVGCYSFNGNKIITTGGGGMLVTHSQQLAERVRYYTTQAKDDAENFIHHEVGYNYRLTNIQAAIGCAQLEKLDEFIKIKRENFVLYQELLHRAPGLRLVAEPVNTHSNYWHYTLLINEAEFGMNAAQLKQRLKENNMESRLIWELNHRQKPYQSFQAYKIEKAIQLHEAGLNIPCSVQLGKEDVVRVCQVIRGAS